MKEKRLSPKFYKNVLKPIQIEGRGNENQIDYQNKLNNMRYRLARITNIVWDSCH
jgi:hypothetical protein